MTIYIPYYDRGAYHIKEADSDRARRIGKSWLYNGTIYGDKAYTTEAGAQADIDKRYHEARKSEYNPV